MTASALAMPAENRWKARPVVARGIRGLSLVLPLGVALIVTYAASRLLPPADGRLDQIRWWIVLSAVAWSTVILVERAARKLLPLSALFGLSLTFPDQAPNRFRTAIRQGTVAQLQRKIVDIREQGFDDDPVLAAEELIELAAALSVHDRLTRGHSERVRAYTRLIALELGLPNDEVERLQWAGLAHDVGKLFISSEILNKPGTLTDEEYEEVKTHAARGAALVEPLRPWLGDATDAVGQHHERWDGTGYPLGIAGTDISLAGRIVAVADAFDVITNARSYKTPASVATARRELVRCSGTHFDPRVVRAFLNVGLGRMRALAGPLSVAAQIPVVGALGTAAGGAAATVSAAAIAATGVVGGFTDIDVPHFDAGFRNDVVAAAAPSPSTTIAAASGTDLAVDIGATTTTITSTVRDTTAIRTDNTAEERSGPSGASSATPSPAPSALASSISPSTTDTRPPATTSPTTTTTQPPRMPRRQHLTMSGPAADTFWMSSNVQKRSGAEPDHDDDGDPGFTIEKGKQKLDEDEQSDYQHWILRPATALRLNGLVFLDLWSTTAEFDDDEDIDYSVWLHDCAVGGGDCRLLASVLDVRVDEWNGGVADFVRRRIDIGSVSTTIQPGRQLRVRFMTGREDVWIASSKTRPSALVVPVV